MELPAAISEGLRLGSDPLHSPQARGATAGWKFTLHDPINPPE